MSNTEHQQWIDTWLATNNPYGRCAEATKQMHETFPDLVRVRGHAETDWGRRAHWWLVTADGEVVDPTATQFGFVLAYDPWKPGDKAQVGTCANCGDEIWRPLQTLDVKPKHECICSPQCHASYAAYINGTT